MMELKAEIYKSGREGEREMAKWKNLDVVEVNFSKKNLLEEVGEWASDDGI